MENKEGTYVLPSAEKALGKLIKNISSHPILTPEQVIRFTVEFLQLCTKARKVLCKVSIANNPMYYTFEKRGNTAKISVDFINARLFNEYQTTTYKHFYHELPGKKTYDIYLLEPSQDLLTKNANAISRAITLCFTTIERCELIVKHRQETNQFMQMAEFLPQMVWTADDQGKILYVNKKCESTTGLPKFELMSCGWTDVMHPEDYEKFFHNWISTSKPMEVYEENIRIKNYFGYQYKWFNFKITPLSVEDGARTFLGCANDIHTLKSSEKQKENMLMIASHELKGPITTIKAYLQLLQKTQNQSEFDKGFLNKAASYTEKLNKLVDQLLDSGKNFQALKYQFTNTSFKDFIIECIDGFAKANPSHEFVLRGDLENIFINADKEKLEQVIVNLLSNAVKYSPEANKVIIAVTKEFDQVRVMITDFGIGIADDFTCQVFLPETRSNIARERFNGFGLGLYLCAEIIKAHKGTIGVNSKEGRGSTFYFNLPIQ